MLSRDRDLGRALMVFAIDPEGQQTELFEDVAFGIRQIPKGFGSWLSLQ